MCTEINKNSEQTELFVFFLSFNMQGNHIYACHEKKMFNILRLENIAINDTTKDNLGI